MSCHFLLYAIFPTQGSNPSLCVSCISRVDSLPLCHLGSPMYILKMLKKTDKQKLHLNRVRRSGTSLEVHQLRLCTPNAGGLGCISLVRDYIPHAAAESPMCHNSDLVQPNKYKIFLKKQRQEAEWEALRTCEALLSGQGLSQWKSMYCLQEPSQPPLPSTKAFSFRGWAGTSMWLSRVEIPKLQLSSDLHKPISAGEISGSQFVSGQQRCLCGC